MTLLSVRVQPRSSQRKVVPDGSGGYKVWVTAAPVDGAANEAVIDLLSDVLGSSVRLLKGSTSRTKVFSVELSPEEVRKILG